jgi:oxalate decarboxylase/phosphoglucose isomerase-like protein (cupin superfamily)
MQKLTIGALTVTTLLAFSPTCFAQAATEKPKAAAPVAKHIVVAPDQVKWGAPPEAAISGTPSVDPGGQLRFATIQGDPMKPGVPFTIELNCTDGYKAAPHWHPTAENLVVLKGTFALATGDKYDESAMLDMATGTFGYMPAHVHHFGLCKGETDVLVYGMGPFKLNFLGPAGAATKKTPAKKTAGK